MEKFIQTIYTTCYDLNATENCTAVIHHNRIKDLSVRTSAPACLAYRALSKTCVAPTPFCHAVNINEVVMGANSQKTAICEEEKQCLSLIKAERKHLRRPDTVLMTSQLYLVASAATKSNIALYGYSRVQEYIYIYQPETTAHSGIYKSLEITAVSLRWNTDTEFRLRDLTW